MVKNSSEKDKGKQRSKKGGKKDGPKRALSCYMLYAQERRKALRTEQPELKICDASKIIANDWNQLTEIEKEPYMKLAQEAKERYEEEKEKVKKGKKKGKGNDSD